MKTLLQFTAVLVLLALIMVNAQTVITPPSVSDAFRKEFGAARNVQWSASHEIYQSRFELGDQQFIAYFNQKGTLLLTAHRVELSQAPAAVRNSIAQLEYQFDASSPTEMYEVTEVGGTEYYINVNGKTEFISALATFNGNCKVLKKSGKALTAEQSDILAQMR